MHGGSLEGEDLEKLGGEREISEGGSWWVKPDLERIQGGELKHKERSEPEERGERNTCDKKTSTTWFGEEEL